MQFCYLLLVASLFLTIFLCFCILTTSLSLTLALALTPQTICESGHTIKATLQRTVAWAVTAKVAP